MLNSFPGANQYYSNMDNIPCSRKQQQNSYGLVGFNSANS